MNQDKAFLLHSVARNICVHTGLSQILSQHGRSGMFPVLRCALTCIQAAQTAAARRSVIRLSHRDEVSYALQNLKDRLHHSYPTKVILTSTLVPACDRLPSVHRGVAVSAAVSGGLPGRYPFPQREAIDSTCRHAVHCGGHPVPWVSCRCTGGAGWHLLRSYH